MPDPENLEIDASKPPETPPAPSIVDVAKEFAAQLTKALPQAPTPISAASPAAIDWDAEHKAAKARVDELAAEGKVGEANELWTNYVLRRNSASQGDAASNPVVISQLETVKREVKRDNARAFELYGAEIQAEIDRLPLGERLSHTSWEAALQKVQGRHLKDILAEEEKRWNKERAVAPVATAQGSRGSRPGASGAAAGNDDGLDDNERGVAVSLGVSPVKYAESKKLMEDYKHADGNFKDVPLTSTGARIQPGQF
jgi:hypothetical protein